MAISTTYVIAVKPRTTRFWLRLCTAEPTENYTREIFDPLDPKIEEAIIHADEEYYELWIIEQHFSETQLGGLVCTDVFKYKGEYYTFWNPPQGEVSEGIPVPDIEVLGPFYAGWSGLGVAWLVAGIVHFKKQR